MASMFRMLSSLIKRLIEYLRAGSWTSHLIQWMGLTRSHMTVWFVIVWVAIIMIATIWISSISSVNLRTIPSLLEMENCTKQWTVDCVDRLLSTL